jgi:hypothetical protein
MSGMNVRDRNAGFAAEQAQVWGFSKGTAIDSKSYFAPGAKIFYVDPNNAQAVDLGNLGEDPTVPLATVNAAVTLARSYMGDTIIVGSNDFWQYSAGQRNTPILETLTIPVTKGGIRIVGAGVNPLGVSWSPANDSEAAITVHAADVLVEGFVFYSANSNCIGIRAVWDGATMYGDNLTVRGCFFSDVLDYGIQLDFTYYTQIYNNYFDNIAIAAIHSLDVEGDPDFAMISDNTFMSCTAAIDLEDTDGCSIWRNLIYGNPAGTNNFIDLTGGADNIVADNFLACSVAQYDVTCSDATSGAWINNHCINGDPVANPV